MKLKLEIKKPVTNELLARIMDEAKATNAKMETILNSGRAQVTAPVIQHSFSDDLLVKDLVRSDSKPFGCFFETVPKDLIDALNQSEKYELKPKI